jgi:uncharacterized small protein (DUF1192 family)
MEDDLPRPKGDAATKLAGESLDRYSHGELNERIQLCEAEIVRVVAHRDKAKAHRMAADALFGSKPALADPPDPTRR